MLPYPVYFWVSREHSELARRIERGLRLALADFDRKVTGFIDRGTLIGVETRTSSPVRIPREDDFQSPSLKGLYPVGEGAGYAGGIVSAAMDGEKVASMIALSI